MTRRASLAVVGIAAGILAVLFLVVQVLDADEDGSLVNGTVAPSAQGEANPGPPAVSPTPAPLPGGDPPAQAAETLDQLIAVADDVSPEIVEQTVCGLRGSVLRNLIGEDFDGDWDVLRDASLVAEDLARTYGQVADADRKVYEGVRLVQQTAIAWRTALGYAEAGEMDQAQEAMETAEGYLQQLDKPGAAAVLCPN